MPSHSRTPAVGLLSCLVIACGRARTEMPGTSADSAFAALQVRRASIRYAADTPPRGAQVRIFTTDPTALSAVHDFLEFQRRDHRAKGHAH